MAIEVSDAEVQIQPRMNEQETQVKQVEKREQEM